VQNDRFAKAVERITDFKRSCAELNSALASDMPDTVLGAFLTTWVAEYPLHPWREDIFRFATALTAGL
jgi:hypothetical protein